MNVKIDGIQHLWRRDEHIWGYDFSDTRLTGSLLWRCLDKLEWEWTLVDFWDVGLMKVSSRYTLLTFKDQETLEVNKKLFAKHWKLDDKNLFNVNDKNNIVVPREDFTVRFGGKDYLLVIAKKNDDVDVEYTSVNEWIYEWVVVDAEKYFTDSSKTQVLEGGDKMRDILWEQEW